MSRSNPSVNIPNPSTKWFEWNSTAKCFGYWDKEKKELVLVKLPFTFIMLDRTSTVRGYNKQVGSGIYSNEVRDLREQPLIVKYFAGGEVASGFWADIKDRVVARKGKFALNVYLAYREDNKLRIGCFQAVGCAVGAWIDFEKAAGKAILEKAVTCKTFVNDKSGEVEFNAPVFSLGEVTPETNAQALALDKELQEYFKGYFKRPSTDRAQSAAAQPTDASPHNEQEPPAEPEPETQPENHDPDIPF